MAHRALEFPPEQAHALRRARRLAWITIVYLATAVTAVGLTMGGSQAMKTVALEDLLSFIPPISFLIAAKRATKAVDAEHPYGHHRTVGVAYLAGSLALLVFGTWLLVEGVSKLITAEHPVIGTVQVAGRTAWLGWPMIAASLYSAIPAVILGKMKVPLAQKLHDKGLHADGRMNVADWKSGLAAVAGILGIAMGFWWADALAGSLIALDIAWDGVRNTRIAATDLMDHRPKRVDGGAPDDLPDRLEREILALPWVANAAVRLREEGHVLFGEVFVCPSDEADLLGKIQAAQELVHRFHWRLFDVQVVPVRHVEELD